MSKDPRAKRRAVRLASLTVEERADTLRRLSGYLAVWRLALAQQRERLGQQSVLDGGPDTWLYVTALGAALRCVGLAEAVGVDVSAARRAFDAAVPNAKKIRDVIEHLEDYELGVGDLQSDARTRRMEFLWCSDHEGVSYFEIQGLGMRFDVRETHQALDRLLDDAMLAVHEARELTRGDVP